MRKLTLATVAATSALALVLTGCSTKASGGDGGGGEGDVKTDVGVTDDTITLLALNDLSGVFKVISLAYDHGINIWVDQVNADGGICGREIKIDLQDSAYKVDNALPLYEQEKSNVLGAISIGGSHIIAALKQKIISDNLPTIPAAWASVNLDAPQLLMIGQTYDVEMINGLSWMSDQGMIAEGDTIGHVYVDSEYGQNALLGSKGFAEENGMTVTEAKIASTDTDMTAIVTKMKADGVKAIAVTTPPAALGSIALQNQAQGLNVPMIGSNPVFAPTLLEDPGVTAALKNYYQVTSYAPIGSEVPAAQELLGKLQEITDEQPNIGTSQGYVWGLAWQELLQTACDNGDLTRAGIMEAMSQVDALETNGLTGTLSFATEGTPTTREAFIVAPDPNVPGGLTVMQGLFESEAAKKYKTPYEK